METLYRKVAVSEPSQFEHNKYYYFVDFDGNIQRDCFFNYASFDEYTHRYKHFLVEISEPIKSDNTQTLQNALEQIEKLEAENKELLKILEETLKLNKKVLEQMIDSGIESDIVDFELEYTIKKIESLIQKPNIN